MRYPRREVSNQGKEPFAFGTAQQKRSICVLLAVALVSACQGEDVQQQTSGTKPSSNLASPKIGSKLKAFFAPAPPNKPALPSKIAAFERLRRRLIDSKAIEKDDGSGPSTLVAHYDSTGAVAGVWALGLGGLGVAVDHSAMVSAQKEKFDSVVQAFLVSNSALLTDGKSLVGPVLSSYQLPGGKAMHNLVYRQVVDEIPVFGDEVTATFIDGVLVSMNGAIEDTATVLAAKGRLSPEQLAGPPTSVNADLDLNSESLAGLPELVWHHDAQQLVYQLKIANKNGSGATIYQVSAETSEILSEFEDGLVGGGYWTELNRTYRVFAPDPNDWNPFASFYYDWPWVAAAYVNPPSATYYNHSDFGYLHYANPTYGYVYTGPETLTRSSSNRKQYKYYGDFTASYDPLGGRGQTFASQHTVRWMEHAAQVAAHTLFKGFYNSSIANRPVTVTTGTPGGGSYTHFGCDDWGLSNTDCVEIAPMTQPFGSADTASLGNIFHEYGHVADIRIKNDVRTNHGCEQASLEEAIAEMWAMTAFMWTWGINTTLTDYNGHGDPNTLETQGYLYALGLSAPHNARPHLDNNANIVCYDTRNTPPPDCAGNNFWKYDYGTGIVQAYWESAHGVNCGGSGCFVLNDGATDVAARDALAYAMSTTSVGGSFMPFAANFLNYYYYNIGWTQWNNRWWIFNHHRLIGPNFGYSPCHAW